MPHMTWQGDKVVSHSPINPNHLVCILVHLLLYALILPYFCFQPTYWPAVHVTNEYREKEECCEPTKVQQALAVWGPQGGRKAACLRSCSSKAQLENHFLLIFESQCRT